MDSSSLLPPLIRTMMTKGERKKLGTSIVLFADISGFTQLTESLMSEGVEGSEKLCDILNGVFEPIIKELPVLN